MPLEILTVPCLADNYAFLVHDAASGDTALVDAPEPGPVLAALNQRGWRLSDVLLTHHHWDHIDGLPGILEHHKPRVIGARADAHRLPPLDLAVGDGDSFDVCGQTAQVIDVSGHTVGHVAFYLPDAAAVFTADSLMALGCGRLFEGTPDQMWQSLGKLAVLPADTVVYSGHEYTASNGRFAITVDPDNPELAARIAEIARLREHDIPTVPSLLSLELATNPFLRAHLPGPQQAVGMAGGDPAKVFAEIRRRKDSF